MRSIKLFYILILLTSVFSLASCHSSKKVTKHEEKPHVEHHIDVKHASKERKAIVEEAYTWLGTPYKYATQQKGKSTDCSGLTMVVYETVTGIKIPRNSAKQAEFCDQIKTKEVKPGDLVFFATGKDPNKVSHVGIMVDEDNFIHASSSKGVVVSQLSSNYYTRTFLMFGRVPGLKN